ncbi:MAG: tetratricopeptide repeat protein [Dehalococcoidia bacterium]|nr:tetratricopeptide repeat protein [Dehalococcoidia bacterium]
MLPAMSELRVPRVSPDLVGRDEERGALRQLVDGAAAGAGAVLLLSGEAGVGKSRLAGELRATAEQRGLTVLFGHGYPEDQAVPLAALADVAGLSDLDAPEDSARPVRTLALSRALEAAASRRPHCLVLEDAHWSDEASLEVFARLARRAHQLPLLLALTFRPEQTDAALRAFLDALDRDRRAVELRVGPLSPAQTGALVQRLLGMRRLPRREMTEALHGLTEGNPFFIEETLHAVIEAGQLDPASDTWDARVLDQLRPPRAVQHAVQRQLESVDEATRHVLTLAAVMGRRFDLDAVAAVEGRPVADLLPSIRQAVGAQLVVDATDGDLQFRHALTREAIYSDLLARERQEMHLAVARSFEGQGGDDAGASAGTLAHHYYRAREWARALEWSERAAEAAIEMSAPRAATAMLTQAIHAAEQLGRTPSVSMRSRRAAARETVGDFAGSREDYELALSLARSARAPAEEFAALLALGMLWASRDYESAEHYYLEALALARTVADPLLIARALNHVGNWQANAGDPAVACEQHEEALALAEATEDRRAIAETLDLLGMALVMRAQYGGAIGPFARALAAAESLGDERMLASLLATVSGYAGAAEMAATWLPPDVGWGVPEGEQALRIARALEWPAGEAYALTALAAAYQARGEYGRALDLATAALDIAEAVGHQQWTLGCLATLGEIEADLHRWEEAREHVSRALALAESLHSRFWEGVSRAQLARGLIVSGDAVGASALLDAGRAPLLDTQDGRLLMLVRGQAALRLGDTQAAHHAAQRLIETSAGGPDGVMPHVWRLLGETLAARGDIEGAQTHLREGRETARQYGWRAEEWRATCALARLLDTAGDDRATEEWAAAAQRLDLLAASLPEGGAARQQFLERAAAQEGLPRRQRESSRPAGLTAREHEVLTLIASGLSNAEIAARLVIERRTVETHVAHIFRKTDVATRHQAIRWALEHGIGAPESRPPTPTP